MASAQFAAAPSSILNSITSSRGRRVAQAIQTIANCCKGPVIAASPANEGQLKSM